MDLPTFLGILGIVVSVVLGLGTYYLTEKHGGLKYEVQHPSDKVCTWNRRDTDSFNLRTA